ncbi:MAG: hypothetical protein ACFFBD_02260 [Candidatus Hodarchaeota archaeon]
MTNIKEYLNRFGTNFRKLVAKLGYLKIFVIWHTLVGLCIYALGPGILYMIQEGNLAIFVFALPVLVLWSFIGISNILFPHHPGDGILAITSQLPFLALATVLLCVILIIWAVIITLREGTKETMLSSS